MNRVAHRVVGLWGALAFSLAFLQCGCRSIPPLAPVNPSEPGWTVRQGQALWRPNGDAPEIAGELLLATNPDGRTLLQFTKNPLPFVTVQTSNDLWQIEFVPKKRHFSGKGAPMARLIWIHLARALNGTPPRAELKFEFLGQHDWQIENRTSGERISGFLNQ